MGFAGGGAGTSPGGNGGDGAAGAAGVGGGGGADGDLANPIGGNGGNGGNALSGLSGGGGGGGGGGNGVVITGHFSNSGAARGGNGGIGGRGSGSLVQGSSGGGGGGGAGGSGIVAGASSLIVTNAGSIDGGNGGVGGFGEGLVIVDGAAGAGGVGIRGSDLTVFNSGTISGGLSGDGVSRSFALQFTGGSNSLTMTGGSLVGGIDLAAGSLTLDGNNSLTDGITLAGTLRLLSSGAAGGGGNTITTTGSVISYADGIDNATPIVLDSNTTQLEVLSFAAATQSGAIGETGGARPIEKIGNGTLILTATNTYTGGTTITGGFLQVGAGGTTGSLGSGNIAIQSGANLTFNRSDDLTVTDAISGDGSLTKIGGGVLNLTGNSNYTGTTSILSGTLAVQAGAIDSSQLIEIGNGATLRALTGFGLASVGSVSILIGGGTIDTGLPNQIVQIFGDIDYGAQLTVTGGGLLFIDDVIGTGSGGINLLSGTLALGGDFSAGEGMIRLANGTTLENAAFGCGCFSLLLDNDIEVEDGGTATINGFGRYTGLAGQLSGGNFRFVNGSQGSEGPGFPALFELTGANSYGNTFIGADVQLALTGAGTLGAGDVEFDSAPSNPFAPLPGSPALIFANSIDYGFEGRILGNGFVLIDTDPFAPNPVAISLYGSNTSGNNFTGSVIINNGRLNIEGEFGDIDNLTAELRVDACSCNPEDATLGGSGTFFGNITVNNGTLAAGSSPGTLNIAGNLTLGAGTILNFELGQPGVVGANVNDFVTVGGQLTLDGTLNVIDFGPAYGPGYYRLFNYGTLIDNGLTIGTIAGGLSTTLLFNISNQVNLRLGPQVIQYWDGGDTTGVASGSGAAGGNGGSGNWSIASTNWTAASGFGVNDSWRATTGVFAGAAAGTVTVEGTQIFEELRFETDGYVLQTGAGGLLNTTGGFSIVQVDPGLTATIGVEITGAAGLTKTGAGTLILSAVNSYTGATDITAGTLQLGANFAFNNSTAVTVAAGATFDLSTFFAQIGSLAGAGNVMGSGGLGLGSDNTNTTYSGTMTGALQLSKAGTGTWTLTGTNTVNFLDLLDGGVTIGATGIVNGSVTIYGFAGTPTLINNGVINGFVTAYGGVTDNNGMINGVVENRSTNFTNDGTISNVGGRALVNIFGGVFTNNGLIQGDVDNAEFASTGTINNAGTITGTFENSAGGILNSTGTINGQLNNRGGTVFLQGQLNGFLTNFGTATTTLSGVTTGIVAYNGQPGGVVFDLAGFNTAIDAISGTGEIRLGGATLTIGGNGGLSVFGGVISGSGGLTQNGTSVAFLFGANTYTGLTLVSAGKLDIQPGGSVAGDVLNNDRFENNGTVGGTLQNAGTADNFGTINQFVNNTAGTFTTTGIVNPLISGLALSNAAGATVYARGQINGLIQNSGTFNVTGALTGITRMNMFGAAVLNLQGNDLSVGGLGGSGTVFISGATLTVGVGNLNSTFGGEITNNGGLTKVGTDRFTLSGTNSYNGTTLVSAGILTLGGAGSIVGPVVNNATFENFGVVGNQVTNNGTYTQIGTLNGSLINTGTASIRGQLNGAVNNDGAATITLTGMTTGIGRVTQTGNALFDLAGFSTSFGSLSGEGEVRLGAAQLTVGGDNSNSIFSGFITGTGGVTKVGTGTLTLTGSNGFSATASVQGGTLALGTSNALPGPTLINIDAGATLALGDTFQVLGALAGAGNIQMGSNGGMLVGNGGLSATFSGTIGSGSVMRKIGTGSQTLAGNTTLTIIYVDDGELVIGAGGVLNAIFGNNNILTNRGTINGFGSNNGAASVLTNSGTINDSVFNEGTLTNSGTIGRVDNRLTLVSTGTLGELGNSGNAQIQGQLVGRVDNSGTILLTGNTTGIGLVDQAAGGVFDLNGFNTVFGSLRGDGEVRLGSAQLSIGGDNSSMDFAGIITGSGAGNGLTKVGTGTLTLSGANTYTGTTSVNAGTLTLGATGRIAGNVVNQATFNNDGRVELVVDNGGTASNGGVIAGGVNNTGTFGSTGSIGSGAQNQIGGIFSARGQINGFVVNRGTFNVTGALTGIGIFLQAGTGQTSLDGNNLTVGALQGDGGVALGGATLTTGDASNVSFFGRITGAGNLTKIGSGALTLAGANSFTGLTTVSAGRLDVSISGSLAGALLNNSLVENRGAIGGLVTNNAIMFSLGTMGGGLTNNAGAQFNNDTLAIITGAVRNDGRLDNFGTINGVVTNTNQLLSARAINGGLINSGTALLGGTLAGPLTNNAGTVALGGTTTGITAFTQLAGATFNLANFSTAIGSLAGAGSVQLGSATLTVGDASSTTFAGVISGTGGLTKVGTGTLTLSNANTYAGLTNVNAGILSVTAAGSLASGAVNLAGLVNAGSILVVDNRAGGTFTNSGTVTNGVLNAGSMTSTGIINLGMNNSGTAQLRGQLNGFVNNNAGTITLTGALTGITALTQAAGATLNLNGFSLALGSLSGAGSVTFGGAVPAGALEPATAQSVDLAAAMAAVTRAGLVPDDNAGGGAMQSMIGAAEVATANAASTAGVAATPNWLVADMAAPVPAGGLTASSGSGRAAGFGLVATESAQVAPGVGLLAIESPMARLGSTAAGSDADTVAVTDGSAATPAGSDRSGALVVDLTGGGPFVQVPDAAAPAAPVLLTAGGSTLTPLALPPATGPVLTVGADNSSTIFAGVISGNGRLAKVGTGTLILTGNNTYTDGTLISGGALQLGNGGTSGSVVGRIENNAVLIVNRSDALTLSGIIDGTGLFVQAGTGTTILTGANAYTGGTLITAGRLRGDTLSLQGQFQINAGTLEFNQAAAGTFAGQLFGAGAVEKTGAGLLTFTGDNSNLTGGTSVLGGELRVNSLLSRSRVTVGNGGTLSGTGITGGIVAQSGGTVAPGAGGFGTLGVNGNSQFLAGSTFAAQVQPAGSDLLLGNGTAQLAGTIAVANAGGVYRFNSVYVLLQADGGRTGTFTTETGLNTFGQPYAPRIVYTPTQVQLLMAPASLIGIAGPDGTPNQRSTLTRIDAAVAAGYDPQPLIALYGLTPRAAFLNGADQLSGEIYATSVRAALDDERLVREATLGRLRLTQDMGFGASFGAWGHAVGAWGSGNTDGNAARYERDQQGFVVGIDGGGTFDGGSWRLGLLGHHLSTDVRVDARGSNAEIERSGAGIYGGLDFGGLRIRAGGTYASLDLEGRRAAAFTGFAESLTGETDGTALQGFAEISYRLQVGASTHVEPYFQAALTHVEFDAFSETGGASRLRVAAEEDDLTTLAFGMRAGTVIPLGGDTNLRLDGAVGARHLSGDRMIFSLISLDASPNQAFDIRSAAADRFALTGNADATFEFSRAVSLSIGYSGVISGNARDHAARATLGIRF